MSSVLSDSDRRLLGGAGMIALTIGVWVGANLGAASLWFYSVAVTAILALALGPIAIGYGRKGEAALAVWAALLLGPVALLVIVPWLRSLPERSQRGRL